MTEGEIVIIATGGTIAGKAANSTDLHGYVSGQMDVQDLLAELPILNSYGPIRLLQFAHMESSDVTVSDWIALANLIEAEVEKETVKGVVLLHGTDSMEETAYFLQLTVHTRKPVVMTGAMRPAGVVSADGPLNIWNAVEVCYSASTTGMGVVLVMNNRILSATSFSKLNTANADAFGSPDFGELGLVQEGKAHLFQKILKKHTYASSFSVKGLRTLPKVEVLYLYGGMDPAIVTATLKSGVEGLVLAGLGHGTIPAPVRAVLQDQEAVLVRASRTGSGTVTPIPLDAPLHLVPSAFLSPVKARILLMLALCKTKDREVIASFMNEY